MGRSSHQNNMGCCQEVCNNVIRLTSFPTAVLPRDQDAGATSRPTSLDITPPITDHHTPMQIDCPPICRP